MVTIIYGTLVHTPTKGQLEILKNSLLVTNEEGIIIHLKPQFPKEEISSFLKQHELLSYQEEVRYLTDSQFLLPGFIDAHIHAPQFPFTGTCTDLPLTEWLNKYTFPCEQKFQDIIWAKKVYEALVKRLLRNGTTTAVYFASIHLEATQLLADITLSLGQRAFVGLVSMDRNAPDNYVDTTETSLTKIETFINYCQQKGDVTKKRRLLTPIITPRFIPTCTIPLLKGLGDLAKKYNVPIQSHISESLDEIAFVKHLHPDLGTDTDIFDDCGLLTNQTIMAHGVHLSDQDVSVLVERGSGVAVCPLSNAYFANGVFPAKRFDHLKQGLGTDVAGGYSPSMLNSIRQAVVSSSYWLEKDKQVNWKTALFMATQGGADAIGIGNMVGSFHQEKQLDALIIDLATKDSPIDLLWEESIELLVEKFINIGDDRCIIDVLVSGAYFEKESK